MKINLIHFVFIFSHCVIFPMVFFLPLVQFSVLLLPSSVSESYHPSSSFILPKGEGCDAVPRPGRLQLPSRAVVPDGRGCHAAEPGQRAVQRRHDAQHVQGHRGRRFSRAGTRTTSTSNRPVVQRRVLRERQSTRRQHRRRPWPYLRFVRLRVEGNGPIQLSVSDERAALLVDRGRVEERAEAVLSPRALLCPPRRVLDRRRRGLLHRQEDDARSSG